MTPTTIATTGTSAVKNMLTTRATRTAKSDARDAAHARHHAGLDDELPENVAAAGPHRFADADFVVRSVTLASMMFMMTMPPTTMNTATSPMVTAKMVPVRFLPRAHQGVGRVDAEGVVFAIGDMAAGAHQGADFVLELQHVAAVGALI